MLKFSDGHTDRQTDRRTNSSTAICYPTGGIKIHMPPGSHVFRNLNADPKFNAQNIIGTNLLQINVASRVLTRKNAPHAGSHVFQRTGIIFELVQDIIGMNLLTKFHEDRTVNVASRAQNIIGTNPLTKFQEDRRINVASRVLTREKCPAPWQPCFSTKGIIFELVQDIIRTNLLTKFHEDRTVNVASRVKNTPPLGSHFFQANIIIFELIQDIIETNLLTKFHEDRTINVASRVLTRNDAPPLVAMFLKQPKPFSHSSIIETNLLTKKIAPPHSGHVFQPTGIIFELFQDIIGMNLLSFMKSDYKCGLYHIRKNAPPLGGHVFQANVTIFELIQEIIKTNLLRKFHEDWTINVASRE
ncbi:hypothetical protein DPMN_022729 [Dreissena polymorpha]|uniref:Uncharacterized protein n=1 Tax=Dreissena polymorpha TaxID=45954 RepID=A0A9D4NPS5_DREPO|nr:hypothetical protein DPMN_022729 [Dreissena polymorpha]